MNSMSNKSNNKIFDLLIADALTEMWDTELSKFSGGEQSEPHKFSEAFERRIRRIKNSIGRKDRIKKCTNIFGRSVITAAAVMGVIFGGLLTQPVVYAAVGDVIRTIFDKYDRYDYAGEELTIENFNSEMRLGYVPDGYRLVSGNYSPIDVSLIYADENEQISFNYGIADGYSFVLDNEHNSYRSFYSGEMEYYYYESSDVDFSNIIIWYNNGYVFSISAHISKDELVKIAENVE